MVSCVVHYINRLPKEKLKKPFWVFLVSVVFICSFSEVPICCSINSQVVCIHMAMEILVHELRLELSSAGIIVPEVLPVDLFPSSSPSRFQKGPRETLGCEERSMFSGCRNDERKCFLPSFSLPCTFDMTYERRQSILRGRGHGLSSPRELGVQTAFNRINSPTKRNTLGTSPCWRRFPYLM